MSDWPTIQLRQIAELITKGTTPTTYGLDYVETGVTFVRVNNITDEDRLDLSECLHIDDRAHTLLGRSQLKAYDVLLTIAGSIGRAAVVDEGALPANCNQAVALIRLKKGVEPGFIARLLSSALGRSQIAAATVQLAQANFSLGQVGGLAFRLPGYAEQKAITRVLETLDTTIRQTEAIIEKLKLVKQGLLHDLLTRGIDANGELRPPQSQAPQLYKDSPLGWIPVDWRIDLLDSIATRGSGHTPSKNVASYWNGGVSWVSLADSHRLDQIYISSTDKEISELGIANSSAVKHAPGTVILSRDAGVGKSAVLASEMAVSQHFMAWRCTDRLNNLYLYFKLQYLKPAFESIAIGSTLKTIGLGYFKRLQVAVAERAEQDLAVDVLMGAEAVIRAHQSELGKLQLLKAGLIDDLLTGRVRVTPLLDTNSAPA